MKVTVFVPGSIGNVGPGFDVLGLAVDGIGDIVTVELTNGDARVDAVTGRDASLVPLDPARNVSAVAANVWLRAAGIDARPIVSIEKGLPLAGGLGGSAASSVGGAYAAALAAGAEPKPEEIIAAALEGEALVAGRHLDNIAPAVLGGLVLVRAVDPVDVIALRTPRDWSAVLVTPRVRVETKAARALLPEQWSRAEWTQQMANTVALAHAFEVGDAALVGRALDDRYAEPRRASLIPHFHDVKRAALAAGALGCSISGSGPTIFAICAEGASAIAEAMRDAFAEVPCDVHVGAFAERGARRM